MTVLTDFTGNRMRNYKIRYFKNCFFFNLIYERNATVDSINGVTNYNSRNVSP